MKKWILMICILVLTLSLTSCNGCGDEEIDAQTAKEIKKISEEKLASLNLVAVASGTIDETQKSYGEGTSYYAYKDFAYGAISFDVDDLLEFYDTSDSVKITSAILDLTRQEYHSAYGAEVIVSLTTKGEETDFESMKTGYEAALEKGSLIVTTAAAEANKDSFDVSALLQKAIDEKWLEKGGNPKLVIYVSMKEAASEHSAEWFGAQSETPPQLLIKYSK